MAEHDIIVIGASLSANQFEQQAEEASEAADLLRRILMNGKGAQSE